MSDREEKRRREKRKYQRIPVRYGSPVPRHVGHGMQVSTRGLFIATNTTVFEKGSPIVIEIEGPGETWTVAAIVRHAYRVHPDFARFTRPGMGIELLAVPPALAAYLASL